LNDEQIALSVKNLAASLDTSLDRVGLPSEVMVVHRDASTLVLLVGWVGESESHRLFR
jgi:hypothetical protein